MDIREIVYEGIDWIRLAQNMVQWRDLVNTVMNLRVPQENREFLDQLSHCYLLVKHCTP
jgi:hypothetical protein